MKHCKMLDWIQRYIKPYHTIMASAKLKELVELAKEAGMEETELCNLLRDERTRQR